MVSIYIGVLAGLIQIFAYFEYLKKIFGGRIRPNTASWSIWAFAAILESISYVFVSGDWVKDILPIACALCAIGIFVVCLKRGHFERINGFDSILVIVDIVILAIWMLTSNPIIANILFVITGIISFIPIIRHVKGDPFAEHARPWFLWSLAYALMTITVVFRWEKWEDLVYPVSFLALHLWVGYLALDRRVIN